MNSRTNQLCVLDTYRNNLVRAGFLVTVYRGMYKRIKKIPKGLSIKDCLKIAKEKEKIMIENKEKAIELKKNMMNSSFAANKRLESIND